MSELNYAKKPIFEIFDKCFIFFPDFVFILSQMFYHTPKNVCFFWNQEQNESKDNKDKFNLFGFAQFSVFFFIKKSMANF